MTIAVHKAGASLCSAWVQTAWNRRWAERDSSSHQYGMTVENRGWEAMTHTAVLFFFLGRQRRRQSACVATRIKASITVHAHEGHEGADCSSDLCLETRGALWGSERDPCPISRDVCGGKDPEIRSGDVTIRHRSSRLSHSADCLCLGLV
jgi:hypothetical protein